MPQNDVQILKELDHLRFEHRRLDSTIDAIAKARPEAEIEIMRLKKQKLVLKDQIVRLEGMIYPDIIA